MPRATPFKTHADLSQPLSVSHMYMLMHAHMHPRVCAHTHSHARPHTHTFLSFSSLFITSFLFIFFPSPCLAVLGAGRTLHQRQVLLESYLVILLLQFKDTISQDYGHILNLFLKFRDRHSLDGKTKISVIFFIVFCYNNRSLREGI